MNKNYICLNVKTIKTFRIILYNDEKYGFMKMVRIQKTLVLKLKSRSKRLELFSLFLFLSEVLVSIQTALNMTNPLLPSYLVGFASRDSLILEFSPTMISLILAGKVGSSIASELGSIRTEQIDALEIMGVNSALILPKIISSILSFPFLVIISMSIGMVGAWIGGLSTDVTTADFMSGLQYDFKPFYISYAIIKTLFFAFIVSSVSSYFGYHAKGGAISVGRSSTKAVVYSSIIILIFNYILTDLILA